MRDSPAASIDKIEFSNAYLDAQSGGGRQITIETVHPAAKARPIPNSMKIYKVSGRFLFEPDSATYPFDTQRFSINLQPKNGEAPFIVQPPPLELRDQSCGIGWLGSRRPSMLAMTKTSCRLSMRSRTRRASCRSTKRASRG